MGHIEKSPKYLFEYQAPATLTQAAPVQNTWYYILGTAATPVKNVKIYKIAVSVATANETLELQGILDGETIAAMAKAATFGNIYFAFNRLNGSALTDNFELDDTVAANRYHAGLFLEAKEARIMVRKTTATGAGTLTGICQYGMLKRA